jgi:tetratricopeptide (TPR) repeat protein
MILALALALAQPAAGGWSSGRPPECAVESGGATANVWERAKAPELRRYCDLLASAASKLAGSATMAEAALTAAREANEALPGHAAPRVFEGRALAVLGKLDDALAALRDGAERDRGSLDDPPALLAWARILARTGHAPEAVEAYRTLLPRSASLSTADRAAAAVEAGLVTMAADRAGLDDAVAALREGLREAQDDTLGVAVLALALALDRRGDGAEARALLADHAQGGRPAIVLDSARGKGLLAVAPAERPALEGLALEAIDVPGAREAWGQYLARLAATASRPWEAHARGHLVVLGSRPPVVHAPPRGAP